MALTTNDLTFILSVFFLPIWLVWELTLLWLRGKGHVSADTGHLAGTISMVMRDRAYQMNAIPFFWSAMTAHWWVNWFDRPVWDVPYPAIAFWLLLAATLGLDIYLWHTPYPTLESLVKVFRAPMVQVGLGFLAAYFLFPQKAPDGGYRWW